MHSSYASYLHEEINSYLRLQSHEPLSRGISKINDLIKVVRNASYSNSQDVDKLCKVAKNAQPSRMSLPAQAGIVDPLQHLKGEHLQAFKDMHHTVPHDVEPAVPTKGCFKVDPKDLYQVNHKLLSSGVAALIPESMGLRDSQGRIITGGITKSIATGSFWTGGLSMSGSVDWCGPNFHTDQS